MADEQRSATNFTPDQQKYLDWVALPKSIRQPKTLTQYARQNSVDRTTLWRWTKVSGFQEAAAAAARDGLKSELPEIFEALAKKAKDGDVPAIKLALEVAGEYTPRQELTGKNGGEMLHRITTIEVIKSYAPEDDDDAT